VLLLGLGSGNLSKLLPRNVILDSVEIDPRVVSLGDKYFTSNGKIENNVFVDDARHFLDIAEDKYSLGHIQDFCDLMINLGGYRMLFSS
jgi:spermidine synthase